MSSSHALIREINKLTTSPTYTPNTPALLSKQSSEAGLLAHKGSVYKIPSPRRKLRTVKTFIPSTDSEQYQHAVGFGSTLNTTTSVDLRGIVVKEPLEHSAIRDACATALELLRREL